MPGFLSLLTEGCCIQILISKYSFLLSKFVKQILFMALKRSPARSRLPREKELSLSVRDSVPWLCRWRVWHEDYLTRNGVQPEIKETSFRHVTEVGLKRDCPNHYITCWRKFSRQNKGATSRMAHLEKFGQFFQVHHSQSVLIFSILNHPCSCLVYYHLFGVFLP